MRAFNHIRPTPMGQSQEWQCSSFLLDRQLIMVLFCRSVHYRVMRHYVVTVKAAYGTMHYCRLSNCRSLKLLWQMCRFQMEYLTEYVLDIGIGKKLSRVMCLVASKIYSKFQKSTMRVTRDRFFPTERHAMLSTPVLSCLRGICKSVDYKERNLTILNVRHWMQILICLASK